MISIELYSASATSALGSGGYYFRLIYHGNALLMPGCADSLCDVNVLLDALAFGQESMPCSVTPSAVVVDGGDCDDGDDSDLSTVHWVLLLVLTLLVGGLIGAAGVVFYERRRKASDPSVSLGAASTHPMHNDI